MVLGHRIRGHRIRGWAGCRWVGVGHRWGLGGRCRAGVGANRIGRWLVGGW